MRAGVSLITFIEKTPVNEHIEQMRLSYVTKSVSFRSDARCRGGGFRVRDLRSGRSGSLPENMPHLTVGMLIDPEARAILRRLAELQYTRNDRFQRGTCAARSDRSSRPEFDDIALRVELFDEEVERLSLFDPLTGQVQSQRCHVIPSNQKRTT